MVFKNYFHLLFHESAIGAKLTRMELGLKIQKYNTKVLKPATKGSVTNVQNGQQGPATSIGDPALVSRRKNMSPTRLEQQQNNE